MKKYLLSAILLLAAIICCGCSKKTDSINVDTTYALENSISTETTIDTATTRKVTEGDIQGIWGYYSQEDGYTEQIVFDDGIATCASVFDAVPDNVYTSVAEYTIYSDHISLYFEETDYTNRLDCTWMGNELVIYKYIDSGADKGNTRIYTKTDSESIIQPNSKKPENSYRENTQKETQESVSSGKRNALRSAKDYLSVMSFSYSGLVFFPYPLVISVGLVYNSYL